MEKPNEERVQDYLELYQHVKEKTGSDDVALAVLEQVGKDRRTELMSTTKQPKGEAGDNDAEASWKQVNYLKRLGVAVPEGCSKKQASELIDQALAR
ncbi:MAG: hypothetical protein IT445_06240 [Phycisphaeraceae bacterium]|nr:hypothetical protein [Phycisphaeraceae bacterium]